MRAGLTRRKAKRPEKRLFVVNEGTNCDLQRRKVDSGGGHSSEDNLCRGLGWAGLHSTLHDRVLESSMWTGCDFHLQRLFSLGFQSPKTRAPSDAFLAMVSELVAIPVFNQTAKLIVFFASIRMKSCALAFVLTRHFCRSREATDQVKISAFEAKNK